MDTESKHRLAKKVAIATGGGAAVAGANAMYRASGSMEAPPAESAAVTYTADTATETSADDLELFEGDYNEVEEIETNMDNADTQASVPNTLDELPFSEAFITARNYCNGGGGVFYWKGNYYNTYTRDEYENLTDDDLERLYQVYKNMVHGDTDKLLSSLERTIETNNTAEPDSFDKTEPEDIYSDPYDTEPEETEDEPESETETDTDTADSDEIDFEGLYS